MYHIVYLSTAVKLMTDEELKDILTTSRKNNKEKNVTGVLLYCEGTFVQLIEGTEEDVKSIYTSVEKDTRHKNIILLISYAAKERVFPSWAMGFASANKEALKEIDGYIDPAHPDFLKTDKNSQAIFILQTFAENNKISG